MADRSKVWNPALSPAMTGWAMTLRSVRAVLCVCALIGMALVFAEGASAAPDEFSVAVHTTPVVAPGDSYMLIYVDIDATGTVPQTDISALITLPASITYVGLFDSDPYGIGASCTSQSATTVECKAARMITYNGRTYATFGLQGRLADDAPLGTETVTVSVTTSADTVPADHTAKDTFVITDTGEIALSVVGPDHSVQVGDLISVRFVIENRGAYPASTGISIDFLEDQLHLVSALGTGCGADPGETVECVLGGCIGSPRPDQGRDCHDIVAGTPTVKVLKFRVLPGAVPRTSTGGVLDPITPDDDRSNNSASITISVTRPPATRSPTSTTRTPTPHTSPTSRQALTHAAEAGSSSGNTLANTGTPVGTDLTAALSAIALGSLLALAGRRPAPGRRRSRHRHVD